MRLLSVLLGILIHAANAKISELDVNNDPRRLFAVESFGFLVGGVHKMTLDKLKVRSEESPCC